MHPALWTLMKLRFRGVFRRIWRALFTLRGMAFLLLGLGVLFLWLLPLALIGLVPPEARMTVEALEDILPATLLAACVMTVILGDDKAIRFDPAEVDLLFAAPLRRRDLLTYKLITHVAGALVAGSFFCVWLLPHVRLPLAAYVGSFLSIWFIQLFQMAFVLGCQTVSARVYGRMRAYTFLGAVAAGAVLFWQVSTRPIDMAAWDAFRTSSTGQVLLMPFRIFGKTLTAQHVFPDLLMWGGAALCVNLLFIGLIVRLDAYYLEAALSSSQKFYALVQRARQGGLLTAWTTPFSTRWRLPALPRMGGVGPIAWRQLTAAARSLPTVLGIAALSLFALTVPRLLVEQQSKEAMLGAVAAGAAIIQLTILFTMLIRFDFRGDLDQMDQLKSLPLSPTGIVLGELATPVAISTLVQVLLLFGLALSLPDLRMLLLVTAAFTLPLNLLLFAVENLLFLLFPSRSVAFNPGDIQGFGHQVVLFMVKMFALFGCITVSVVAGVVVSMAARSVLAVVAVAWITLLLEAAAFLPLLSWAFRRFDPSMHQPE